MGSIPHTKKATYNTPLFKKTYYISTLTSSVVDQPIQFFEKHFPEVFFFGKFCYRSGLLPDLVSLLLLSCVSNWLPFYYLLIFKTYNESIFAGSMDFYTHCTYVTIVFGVSRATIEAIIKNWRTNISNKLSEQFNLATHKQLSLFFSQPEEQSNEHTNKDTSTNIIDEQTNFFSSMNDKWNKLISSSTKIIVHSTYLLRTGGLKLYNTKLLILPCITYIIYKVRGILQNYLDKKNKIANNTKNQHRNLYQKIYESFSHFALNGLYQYKQTIIIQLNKLNFIQAKNSADEIFYNDTLELVNKLYQKVSDLIAPLILFNIYGLPDFTSNMANFAELGQTVESLKKLIESFKEFFDTHTRYESRIKTSYTNISNALILKQQNFINSIDIINDRVYQKLSFLDSASYSCYLFSLINTIGYAVNTLVRPSVLESLGVQIPLITLQNNMCVCFVAYTFIQLAKKVRNRSYAPTHSKPGPQQVNKLLCITSALTTFICVHYSGNYILLVANSIYSLCQPFNIMNPLSPFVTPMVNFIVLAFTHYCSYNTLLRLTTPEITKVTKIKKHNTKLIKNETEVQGECEITIRATDNLLKYGYEDGKTKKEIWSCNIPERGFSIKKGVTNLVGQNSVGKSILLRMLVQSIIKPNNIHHNTNMQVDVIEKTNKKPITRKITEDEVIAFTQGQSNKSHFELPPDCESLQIINIPENMKFKQTQAELFLLAYALKVPNIHTNIIDYNELDDNSKYIIKHINKYMNKWIANCTLLGSQVGEEKKNNDNYQMQLPHETCSGGEFGKVFFALQITMLSVEHFKLHIIDEPGNEMDEGARAAAHELISEQAEEHNKFVICVDHDYNLEIIKFVDQTGSNSEIANDVLVAIFKQQLPILSEDENIEYDNKSKTLTFNNTIDSINNEFIRSLLQINECMKSSTTDHGNSLRLSASTSTLSNSTHSTDSAETDSPTSEKSLDFNYANSNHNATITIMKTTEGEPRELKVIPQQLVKTYSTGGGGGQTPNNRFNTEKQIFRK